MAETSLGSVISINPSSIGKNYPFAEIEYIDISSVGSGVLLGTTSYNIIDAPSRAKRLVSDGDTILSTVRPNRRSFLFIKNPPENVVVSTGFAVLRASEKINSKFLYYVVTNQSFTDYLTVNAKGAAYPAVDTDTIARITIYLPDLSIQYKIASILSAYDDLIENNNRRIKILEEMAQAIYREWFVNFRFPGHQDVRMVQSEPGMIPEEWEVKKLGEICNIVMGQSPRSEFYNDTGKGLPFHQGVADFGDRFPSDRMYCTVQNRVAEAGDILFSVRAPVGRINIANKRMVIGRGLCAIRSRTGNQYFVLKKLKEKFKETDTMGGGTIFKSVTKEDVHGIKIIEPSNKVHDGFDEIINPVFSELEILTNKNVILRKTRDLLLPKLISGEVDVDKF